MHRTAKSKDGNVLQTLSEIGKRAMMRTGFFHAGPELYSNNRREDGSGPAVGGIGYGSHVLCVNVVNLTVEMNASSARCLHVPHTVGQQPTLMVWDVGVLFLLLLYRLVMTSRMCLDGIKVVYCESIVWTASTVPTLHSSCLDSMHSETNCKLLPCTIFMLHGAHSFLNV